MTILIFVVGFTLLVSASCSLFEAVLYSTRTGKLEADRKKPKRRALATAFLRMKREIAIPIAAILILNTFANTAGATLAGMYAAKELGSHMVPLFSILFTLGILFISEILPKTAGAVYWRRLWFYIVWPLMVMKYMLYPAIYVAQSFSRLITKGSTISKITEEEILAVVRLGAKEGEISKQESLMINNIIDLENIHARDIMTPRTVIFSLDSNLTLPEALELADAQGFTRIPVYEKEKENIIGYVMTHDLSSAKNIKQPPQKLAAIARPISFVQEGCDCLQLLTEFLKHRKHISVVSDEFGGVAGLVTLEDIIETLLGTEIIDETDQVVDLQKSARKKGSSKKER